MKGLEQFLSVFGNITILEVTEVIIAVAFFVIFFLKLKKILNDRHDAETRRDEQIKEALDAVHKYPEYRQQSLEIQQEYNKAISVLQETQARMSKQIADMQEDITRRERNKLRDRLLQSYRFYTSAKTNPSQSWTRMESEAFWEMFRDYEDAGGDGYMHTDVQPAMMKLTIVEMN